MRGGGRDGDDDVGDEAAAAVAAGDGDASGSGDSSSPLPPCTECRGSGTCAPSST